MTNAIQVTPLPTDPSQWVMQEKIKQALLYQVMTVHSVLLREKGADYTVLLQSGGNHDAVEGHRIADRTLAAVMIRDRASVFQFKETQSAKLFDIIKALDGTLRAFHMDAKHRLQNGASS